jgi:hypothetical protein
MKRLPAISWGNRNIALLALFATTSLLIGCDKTESLLSSLEHASAVESDCASKQIFMGECSSKVNEFQTAKLKAEQAGINEKRIAASVELGERKSEKGRYTSIYSKIESTLTSEVLNLTPHEENFYPYATPCSGSARNSNLMNLDNEARYKYNQWVSSSRVMYRLLGYRVQYGNRLVAILKTTNTCTTDNLNDDDSKFPYLTDAQLDQLENNKPRNQFFRKYTKTEVVRFDNAGDANLMMAELFK